MATITLDDGSVWDNTSGASTVEGKLTTKVGPGLKQIVTSRFNTTLAAFRGITGDTGPGSRLCIVTGKLSFDTSYPTGGEAADIIADIFPKGIVLGCYFEPLKNAAACAAEYVIATKKIIAYSSASTEVVNATNLSTVTGIRFVAVGY